MPTTYGMPDSEVTATLKTAIAKWHQELEKHSVKIGVLMASNENGPAVKHGGYAAAACVKAVPLKDRLTKHYDVEMLIDEAEWNSLTPAQRLALMDHELSHVLPTGKKDDLNRPKVKIVKADWNVGDGFKDVVQRHGESAIEAWNIRRAYAAMEVAMKVQEIPFEEAA